MNSNLIPAIFYLLLIVLPLVILGYGLNLLRTERNKNSQKLWLQPGDHERIAVHLRKFNWYAAMSSPEREKFNIRVMFFLRSKTFIARKGFPMQTWHKIILSAMACRITAGLEVYGYNALHTILIYPDAYINKASGQKRTGESDINGHVAISWKHTEAGMYSTGEVLNVALHTFAKALRDNEMGKGTNEAWFSNYLVKTERIISKLHLALQQKPHPFFDGYNISRPEFLYTTCIERFFSNPVAMNNAFPELYFHIAVMLNQNPAALSSFGSQPRKVFLSSEKEPGEILIHFGNIDLNQPLFRVLKPLFKTVSFAFAKNGLLVRHGMYSEELEFIPYAQVTAVWYVEQIYDPEDNTHQFYSRPVLRSGQDLECIVDVAYITATQSRCISWRTLNLKKEVIDTLIGILSGHNITVRLRTMQPAWGLHSLP